MNDRTFALDRTIEWPWVVVAISVVTGFVSMRNGALLDPDSAAYLRHAELIRGDLATLLRSPVGEPIVTPGRFPPVYSSVLAGLGVGPLNLGAVRWLAVATSTATLASWAVLFRRHLPPNQAAIGVLALLLGRGWMLPLHGSVMSDGLLMLFASVAFLAMDGALNTAAPSARKRWAIVAVLASVAASLTRLSGIAVVAAVVVGLVWLASSRRVAVMILATVGALGPLALWLLVQPPSVVPGAVAVGDRPLRSYPVAWSELSAARSVLASMVIPGPVLRRGIGSALSIVVALLCSAGVVMLVRLAVTRLRIRCSEVPPEERTAVVFSVAAVSSLVLLVIARRWFDSLIELSIRHLALPWSVLVAVVVLRLPGSTVTARRVAGVLVATAMIGASPAFVRALADPSAASFDLRSDLAASALVERVVAAPHRALGTTRTDAVYLTTGRAVPYLPVPRDPNTGVPNPGYPGDLHRVLDGLAAENGALAVFDIGNPWSPPLDDIVDRGWSITWRSGTEAWLEPHDRTRASGQ